MAHRVTLREIAAKSGYHFTTVSLALRKHSSIPASTQEKILKVANSLGYKPDPVLSALVAYRHEKRPPAFAGTLVWLENYTADYDWQSVPLFREYFEGASEQAEKRGFRIERFDLRSKGMSARRAQQILTTRGIGGLLVPPQVEAHSHIDLDWNTFSAISFGYTLEEPGLHVVSSNHFRMMVKLMEELHERGYQRPGLVMLRRSSERVENKWIAAFLGESFRESETLPHPPLLLDTWDADAFDRWFEQHEPDVLIAGSRQIPELLPHLETSGIRMPKDVGFADHNLSDEDTELAGMKQNPRLVGKAAISVLAGLIQRNEKGPPASPTHTLVDGFWFDAPTVRPRKKRNKNGK